MVYRVAPHLKVKGISIVLCQLEFVASCKGVHPLPLLKDMLVDSISGPEAYHTGEELIMAPSFGVETYLSLGPDSSSRCGGKRLSYSSWVEGRGHGVRGIGNVV